jgi:hypothetical protein
MKKVLFVLAFVVALEGMSFAGTGAPAAPFTFKQSNNVSIEYTVGGTGGTATAQSYIVNTKHAAGDKVYSTSNATSNIWFKTVAVSLTASAGIQTAGESTYSGWSSQ